MGVDPHPDHDKVELTIDERIDWGTFCAYEAELGRELGRIVRLEEIAAEAIANKEPEPAEEDFLWVELPFTQAQAEDAYAAWWAHAAGNQAAWSDHIDEMLDEFWQAIGFELYGTPDDDVDGDDE